MKPIHLNLAASPYRDYRPIYAVVVATSILIAFLMLNNVDTYYRYVRDTRKTRNEIASIEAQIHGGAPPRRGRQRARSGQDRPHLAVERRRSSSTRSSPSARSRGASCSTAWKRCCRPRSASPRSRPQFAENGLVHLSLACEGKSPDTLLTTINRLQRDPHFSNPFPTNQESTPSGYRFGLGVDYRPTVMRVVAK